MLILCDVWCSIVVLYRSMEFAVIMIVTAIAVQYTAALVITPGAMDVASTPD